jgi:hypothetical protein
MVRKPEQGLWRHASGVCFSLLGFGPGLFAIFSRSDKSSPDRTEAELKALCRSLQRGQPYGSTAWVLSVAGRLGLESRIRRRGRPALQKPVRQGAYNWTCPLCVPRLRTGHVITWIGERTNGLMGIEVRTSWDFSARRNEPVASRPQDLSDFRSNGS